MRIGIDARLWNESGVGRYVRNLVEQLLVIDRKNSYSLFVLSRDKEEIKYQISKIKNNWKLEIGSWKLTAVDVRWHTLEEQLKFPLILNKENLDLVHFPYFSVPVFYNKPFVVTIHDLILHHFPTGEASTLPLPLYQLKLFGYKFIISKAARKAKKIITVSNATKDEIIDHLKVDPSKVVVTYEGATDSSKFNPSTSSGLTLSGVERVKGQSSKLRGRYFLYVGNAYPHKNLDRMLKAFSNVKCQMSNVKLVLVGKEDYFYKRLKDKVKKMNLERSVLFYGEVSDGELSVLYKNALALVIPSLMEGFGLPALEAMANKCLVLASDIPSLHEVCGNAAMYFSPYDTKDLVRKMDVILASEARPESPMAIRDAGQASMTRGDKIEKGVERTKRFSWQKMAKETLSIYESCVGD